MRVVVLCDQTHLPKQALFFLKAGTPCLQEEEEEVPRKGGGSGSESSRPLKKSRPSEEDEEEVEEVAGLSGDEESLFLQTHVLLLVLLQISCHAHLRLLPLLRAQREGSLSDPDSQVVCQAAQTPYMFVQLKLRLIEPTIPDFRICSAWRCAAFQGKRWPLSS